MKTMEELLVYRTYTNEQEARTIGEILLKKGIDYQVVNNSPSVDLTFTNGSLLHDFQLCIKGNQFEKADSVLSFSKEELISQVTTDYHLFEFSDSELFEILSKPDEWNKFDYQLSKEILVSRGHSLSETDIKTLNETRLNDLRKTEPNQKGLITIGWITVLLGGLFGIYIGRHLNSASKTLPNGEVAKAYSRYDRKQGFYMYWTGISTFIIYLIIYLLLK